MNEQTISFRIALGVAGAEAGSAIFASKVFSEVASMYWNNLASNIFHPHRDLQAYAVDAMTVPTVDTYSV